MDLNTIFFSDYELKKFPEKSKKSLITYILTTPKLKQKINCCILPESILNNQQFTQQIIDFLQLNKIKIGISMQTKFIRKNEGTPITQDYSWNTLPLIKNYIQQYPQIQSVHLTFPFGKRRIQKSPKYEEYLMHSQYNWTNIALIKQECDKEILIEPLLYFYENSSEDSYIHMRQILWDGIETLKRFGVKMEDLQFIINPFYPNIKGLKNPDVLDAGNIANTTLRCLTEVLSKDKPKIFLKSCNEMGIHSFGKYLRFIKSYNKNLKINFIIGKEIIKQFMDIWAGNSHNLGEAQKKIIDCLLELSGT
jgi:hypothetical protein